MADACQQKNNLKHFRLNGNDRGTSCNNVQQMGMKISDTWRDRGKDKSGAEQGRGRGKKRENGLELLRESQSQVFMEHLVCFVRSVGHKFQVPKGCDLIGYWHVIVFIKKKGSSRDRRSPGLVYVAGTLCCKRSRYKAIFMHIISIYFFPVISLIFIVSFVRKHLHVVYFQKPVITVSSLPAVILMELNFWPDMVRHWQTDSILRTLTHTSAVSGRSASLYDRHIEMRWTFEFWGVFLSLKTISLSLNLI